MLKEDNLFIGFALGVTMPVLGYLLVEGILNGLDQMGIRGIGNTVITFKERTMMLIAICTNLLPFWLHTKLRNDNTMRGIFLATGIYAIMWVYFYGMGLIQQS